MYFMSVSWASPSRDLTIAGISVALVELRIVTRVVRVRFCELSKYCQLDIITSNEAERMGKSGKRSVHLGLVDIRPIWCTIKDGSQCTSNITPS
jgi:hypothetical protein